MARFTVTIEQHKRDYSGTLSRPVARRGFHYLFQAKSWAYLWFKRNPTAYRYADIEGEDGTSLTSPTDGPANVEDWT